MDSPDAPRWTRALAACESALAALGIALFVAVMLAVCAEVLMRYHFNRPIAWVVELGEYALLWITFLGAPYVLRLGGHVRVDILLVRLSAAWRRRCGLASSASGALVSLVLLVFGANVTWTAFVRGSFKPTGIDVPTWIVVSVIPIGGALLFLRFLRLFEEYRRGTTDFGTEGAHP